MAELATLARPYGNAVFALAKSASALPRWSRLLSVLGAAAGEAQVQALIESPEIAAQTKAHRLAELCGDDIDPAGRQFLQVLSGNGRLALLGEIQGRFEELKALEERTLDVEVRSAQPLSDVQTETLTAALQRRFDKEVTLSSTVDGDLLGGAVIRAGDMVIDGSVRGRLAKLAETMARA